MQTKFHAYLDTSGENNTMKPEGRRRMFSFPHYKKNVPQDILRRSYLIGFTANQNGTWVPFTSGTGEKLQKTKILDK